MKLLTALATIAIVLTPQVAQASDAHLDACTGTQLAMLSANIKTYEAFLTGIDSCKAAALDRLNNGVKDTDNSEALREAQALQKEIEAIAEKRNAPQDARPPITTEEGSEVLIPTPNALVEESSDSTLTECLAEVAAAKVSKGDKKIYATMCESNEGFRTQTIEFIKSKYN